VFFEKGLVDKEVCFDASLSLGVLVTFLGGASFW